jgi:hypothetical protein
LIAVLAAACSDGAPPTAAKLTPPDSALKTIAANADWRECSSYNYGNTFECSYSGTHGYEPDFWDHVQKLWNTTTDDCQSASKAAYCDSELFGPNSAYPDAPEQPEFPWDHELTELIPPPSCPPAPDAVPAIKAYCAGKPPTSSQKDIMQAALNRMKLISDYCAALAAIGEVLLARPDAIRIFPQSSFQFSGATPTGADSSANAWMVISNRVFKHPDAAHASIKDPDHPYRMTVQWVLAHELDHLKGENDLATDQWLTPQTKSCSDVPNQ